MERYGWDHFSPNINVDEITDGPHGRFFIIVIHMIVTCDGGRRQLGMPTCATEPSPSLERGGPGKN